MLHNYLTTALRNLLRNKAHTVINLVGLALGISCCLIITMYVQDELNYDQFHAKKDRIFRVSNRMRLAGNEDHYALSSMAVGPSLKETYPEVEAFARIRYNSGRIAVKYGEKLFNEVRFYMVDPQIFDIFSFELISGNPKKALENPRSIVITTSIARKYFGKENPMGKMLELDGQDFTVTGVMEDLPSNTDLPSTP